MSKRGSIRAELVEASTATGRRKWTRRQEAWKASGWHRTYCNGSSSALLAFVVIGLMRQIGELRLRVGEERENGIAVGDKAPLFQGEGLNGAVDLETMVGERLLVLFVHPTCPALQGTLQKPQRRAGAHRTTRREDGARKRRQPRAEPGDG